MLAVGAVLALDQIELDRLPALAEHAAGDELGIARAERLVVEERAEAALPVDERAVAVERRDPNVVAHGPQHTHA